MPRPLREILIVLLRELIEQVRSTRALVFTGLFSAMSIGVVVLISRVVSAVRERVAEIPDEAREKALSEGLTQIFDDPLVADFVMEVPAELLGVFMLNIHVLPFLVFLMTFDVISAELKDRAIRFDLLRCSRASYYLGKLGAHLIIFTSIVAVMYAITIGYIHFVSGTAENFTDTIPHALRVWAITVVFGGAFVALQVGISAFFTRTIAALMMSFIIFAVLSVLTAAEVPYLQWISPFTYRDGLWNPLTDELMKSLAAYTALGFAGGGIGLLWMTRRDV